MKRPVIKWWRFCLAIIAGTAASAQILAMLHYWDGPHGLTLKVLPFTPLLALAYLLFMLPTAFVAGIPAVLILARLGWLRAWVVILIGTLVGAAWAIPSIGHKPPPYEMAVFFGLGGLMASAIFWFVYAGANKQIYPTRKS